MALKIMQFLSFLNGLSLGAVLIVAIGTQNLFVLRQGIGRNRIFVVCLISALIDAALIILGALGLGAMIAMMEGVVRLAVWGGAAFVIVFGLLSCKRAIIGGGAGYNNASQSAVISSLPKVIAATLAFGLLNPHVYVDTVLLLGGIAAQYDIESRLYFVTGAVLSSFLWFFVLGYGARLLAPVLQSHWRNGRSICWLPRSCLWLVGN